MKRAQLRRVFHVVNGGTPTSEPRNWGGEVAWATPVDLAQVNGGRLHETERNLTAEGLANGSRLVPAASLIVSTRAPIGYVAECSIPMSFNQGCRGLVARGEVDIRYYRYQMLSLAERLGALGQGSTFVELSGDALSAVELATPSFEVQRAIADYIDTETARIDSLITKKEQMIELLQLRTESLIAANLDPAITRWGEAPLKSVAKLAVSNVDKKSYDGQVPVKLCNYTDVYYNRRITNQLDFMSATADAQQVQRLTLHAGDVLITKDSETADDIAVPALVREDLPGVVLGYHLALIRPTSVNGDFLYWAIRSRRSRDAFSLAASGVTRVGLRQDAMGRVPIPAVPSAMQSDLTEAIERDVGLCEDAVRKLSAQANLLRERRQALITASVTGELEVPGVAA